MKLHSTKIYRRNVQPILWQLRRLYKSTYSDPKVAIAERYMRDANADQLKNERDAKFSEAYSQYRNNILAQKQNYANMRTQIADENKKN